MKGIIFSGGEYPIGSSALRNRMLHDGLAANGIDSNIIIVHPAPSKEDKENSEDFVHFMLPPLKQNLDSKRRMKKGMSFFYFRLLGTYKGYFFLCKNKDIEFVFLYGSGFLEGLLVYIFCKKNRKLFFSEKNDEVRSKFKKRSFINMLAAFYENLFDQYILGKVDALFVVSKYLEDKYKSQFPALKIKRSVPSLINYDQYLQLAQNNIFELKDYDFSPLTYDSTIKILFSGSCIFTNGLIFFMNCAKRVLDKNPSFQIEIIFLFFKGNVQEIKEYATMIGLNNVLAIYENVYYPYIPAIYKYADILVLPEMGDIVAKAGFPGKSAEYLASGKSIICTDFSNMKDYFISEYNCLMSPLNDSELYTNNLTRLIIDEGLRSRLGDKAVQTAIDFFDYKKGVSQIIEVIEQTMKIIH
jgi:glycosyltransferase involved in cell wall biosynthesis